MSTYDTILAEASDLSVVDRMLLIEALWDSLPPGKLPPLDEQWLEEIARRSAEFDSGTASTVPWSEIKASVLNRLDGKGV